jgi:hypothetical protein
MNILRVEQVGRFIITEVEEEGKKAVGIARKSFEDAHDDDLGIKVSLGRAYTALQKKQSKTHIHHVLMG